MRGGNRLKTCLMVLERQGQGSLRVDGGREGQLCQTGKSGQRPSQRKRSFSSTTLAVDGGSLFFARLLREPHNRLRGDVHLDYLAIPIRNVPGLFGAFDMHHSCAQRLSKGAERDNHGDGEDGPEQAQRAWTRLAMHSVSPLCEPDPPRSTPRSQGRYHGGRGERKPMASRLESTEKPC